MKISANLDSKSFLTLLFLVFFLSVHVKCDLPVHCKREKIEGDWVFKIEDIKFTPSLKSLKTTCTHGFPDKIEETVGDIDFKFEKYQKDINVKLQGDYKVYENGSAVGTWTPVYDEGFILWYKDSVFTAFMKYYYKYQGAPKHSSNCNKTMIGWYIPNKNERHSNWSCFFGIKKDVLELSKKSKKKMLFFLQKKSFQKHAEKKRSNQKNHAKRSKGTVPKLFNSTPETNFLAIGESLSLTNKSGLSLKAKMKYEDQVELINEINQLGLPWEADFHEDFKGMSLLELNEHVGIKRKRKLSRVHLSTPKGKLTNNHKTYQKFLQVRLKEVKNENIHPEQDSTHVKDFEQIRKYIDKDIKDISQHSLPKNWDWTNVGGRDYTYKPIKQGHCGSCYVFSTVGSLQTRKNILTDLKDKTVFSRQFPLSCSFYTEGCKGGYPVLIGKFLNEFELVEESCMKYEAYNVDCNKVCDYTKSKKKYTVSKYGYLGGFYGNTSEVDMMKEIRARGPIPGNITVPWSFSYYKKGIYTGTKLKKNAGKLSNVTLFQKKISWEKVDHSILIVGWGEENGIKYWKGLNTWGEKWGEAGFFKILRGENECGIESMGDYFNIKIEDRK